ncbi:MAG: hypothetical protein AMJ54_03100 [Deltaproteobacteria bacterium SG8_13]|nr:MAG: hypothetical protein AMJ54_03100 [Deltaproteobacteria bacterium SG8_13]
MSSHGAADTAIASPLSVGQCHRCAKGLPAGFDREKNLQSAALSAAIYWLTLDISTPVLLPEKMSDDYGSIDAFVPVAGTGSVFGRCSLQRNLRFTSNFRQRLRRDETDPRWFADLHILPTEAVLTRRCR